jgi:hypothetical protein
MSNISLVEQPRYGETVNDFIYKVKGKCNDENIDIVFDCLGAIVLNTSCSVNAINAFLKKHNIEIKCNYDYHNLYWEALNPNKTIEEVDNLKVKVKPISLQSCENLESLLETLSNKEHKRSGKDALKSAVSTMEAVLKSVTGKSDFDKSIKHFKDKKVGNMAIIRKGNEYWKLANEKFRDCRHGTVDSEMKELTLVEAIFWVKEITNYVTYIIDISKQ